MKKIILGAIVGAALVMLGVFLADWRREIPKTTTTSSAVSTQTSASPPPEDVRSKSAEAPGKTQADPTKDWNSLSPSEHFKAYHRMRQTLPAEVAATEFQTLKQRIERDAPELDVLEVIRDSQIGAATVLNKHGGQLYKLGGLVLSTTEHDATLVIHNVELICTFADDHWKDEIPKSKPYLYVAGLFESFDNQAPSPHITMAQCCSIGSFYIGRPHSSEEVRKSLEGFQEDAISKLRKDLNADILEKGPNP